MKNKENNFNSLHWASCDFVILFFFTTYSIQIKYISLMELIHKKTDGEILTILSGSKKEKKSFTSTERLFSQVTLFDVMRNISTLDALKNYTLNALKNASTMVHE